MTAIVDYGVGNLFSLISSLRYLKQDAVLTSEEEVINAADRVILPGVGAFGDAAEKLRESGLDAVIRKQAFAGKPLLGICLGMQLLFEKSCEFGEHQGLGLLKGSIIPMQGTIPKGLKIPQMGWNALQIRRPHPLLQQIREGDCVYFVHSFYASDCEESILAVCEYGTAVPAAVAGENVMGCQFHPEKSGKVGLSILKAFCEVTI